MLRLCIAGATGWTGGALVRGGREAPDLELRSAVSRSAAGGEIDGAPVYASAAEALEGVDVLVDYTSVEAVKGNTLAAIEAGVPVVIGTSGLTADDFADIDAAARDRSVGVVASGNFSLSAAMASAAALLAARRPPAERGGYPPRGAGKPRAAGAPPPASSPSGWGSHNGPARSTRST